MSLPACKCPPSSLCPLNSSVKSPSCIIPAMYLRESESHLSCVVRVHRRFSKGSGYSPTPHRSVKTPLYIHPSREPRKGGGRGDLLMLHFWCTNTASHFATSSWYLAFFQQLPGIPKASISFSLSLSFSAFPPLPPFAAPLRPPTLLAVLVGSRGALWDAGAGCLLGVSAGESSMAVSICDSLGWRGEEDIGVEECASGRDGLTWGLRWTNLGSWTSCEGGNRGFWKWENKCLPSIRLHLC